MTLATAGLGLLAAWITGYFVGRRFADRGMRQVATANQDMRRAQHVACEMEKIVASVRRDLARHRAGVAQFETQIHKVRCDGGQDVVEQLMEETNSVLQPTRRLGMQISLAYDEIRQQSRQLQKIAEFRRDSVTGVLQRRALQKVLDDLCRMLETSERPFAVAVLAVDRFRTVSQQQGHSYADQLLQGLARLLLEGVRGTDVVARGGGEEFVVVLPHTPLAGACGFARRLRGQVLAQLPMTVSCGVAEARPGDTPQTLLARADSALYSAKAGGRNCIYQHNGSQVSLVDGNLAHDLRTHSTAVRPAQQGAEAPLLS